MGNEMEGFIEDDESEGDKSDDPESRAAAKQKAKLAKKKKATAGSGGFTAGFIEGLTDEQRQDVLEVFGNGMDFDWVTAEDDEEKEEQKLEDVKSFVLPLLPDSILTNPIKTLHRYSSLLRLPLEC